MSLVPFTENYCEVVNEGGDSFIEYTAEISTNKCHDTLESKAVTRLEASTVATTSSKEVCCNNYVTVLGSCSNTNHTSDCIQQQRRLLRPHKDAVHHDLGRRFESLDPEDQLLGTGCSGDVGDDAAAARDCG